MNLQEGVNIPTSKVSSTGELILTWAELKEYYVSLGGNLAYINYIEFETYSYIWMTFRDQKFYVPYLEKNTTEYDDFETNFKSQCNIPEAPRMRITTNRLGRRLHSRFITFTTSDQDNFDNTDWKENSYADITYTMLDINGNITEDHNLCKETYIDWMPDYSLELSGGSLYIPPELSSRVLSIDSITVSGDIATAVTPEPHNLRKNSMITISGADQQEYNGLKKVTAAPSSLSFNFKVEDVTEDATGIIEALEGDDAWEIHTIGVPDIPEYLGGTVHFIANPRIKWIKGKKLEINAGLNPAELNNHPYLPTNKIRFIVKHPLGARNEFQINLTIYK